MKNLAGAFALILSTAVTAHAEGPLKTGVDGTFAPHAMPTLSGGVEGFNIDLANEIGERTKRGVVIDATQWSGLLPGLQAGTYDFIAAPTTVTDERASNLLFTEGYLNTDYLFVTLATTPGITDLASLKDKVIAVNRGAVYETWARGLTDKIGWKVESFGTNTDAIQAVIAGRAYANVAGNTAGAWAAKKNPRLKASYTHSTGLVWAAPTRKGDTAMRNLIENAIECMKLDGTMAAMHEKWFGLKPAPGSAAVTVYPGYGVPGKAGYDPTEHTPSCN